MNTYINKYRIRLFQRLILLITPMLVLCSTIPAFASWEENIPITITQPDGTELDLLATGDEFFNWLHDKDQFTIIQDPETGFYTYAVMVFDEIVASEYIVGKDSPVKAGLTPGLNYPADYLEELRRNSPMSKLQNPAFMSMVKEDRKHQDGTEAKWTASKLNNIVVFIRFNDQSNFVETTAHYEGMFNTDELSLKKYFKWVSRDQLTINTTMYPSSNNANVASYKDSKDRGYYMPYNEVTNPIGYKGGLTGTQRNNREQKLLENAVNAIKSEIPNSLNLDLNNDGNVDNIVFIINGGSTAWNSLLWPHAAGLSTREVKINGKRVWTYNIMLQSSFNVPTQCHEMGHTLGAPDLYRYSNKSVTPVGRWGLMANQTTPPQSMLAYTQAKYIGFMDESDIPEITESGWYTLNPVTSSSKRAYKIRSSDSDEYFILEYRKRTSTSYESAIPGSGLLIYRINTNAVGNGNGAPDEIYIYRGGGLDTGTNGSYYQSHFTSDVGRTEISNSTSPSCFLSDMSNGNLHITDVGPAGNSIKFFYNKAHCLNTSTKSVTYASNQSIPSSTTALLRIQTSGTHNLTSGQNAAFKSGNDIVLKDGFHAYKNATFKAEVKNCGGLKSIPDLAKLMASNMYTTTLDDNEEEWNESLENNTIDIHVFPNPSSGIFYIETNLANVDAAQIGVYDLANRLIQTIPVGQVTDLVEINMTDQPSGVYILQLVSDSQSASALLTVE